jgi:phosphate transport system protein
VSTRVRGAFAAELDQLHLQVELMAIRVDENLARMREVLRTGDTAVAARAIAADDDIDAMNVSLMARCYDLLGRQSPVASDLRFVVSVLRILGELERIGDLSLRVHKVAEHHDALTVDPAIFAVLDAMAGEAVERFGLALRAWAGLDLDLATDVARRSPSMDEFYERLLARVVDGDGPDAAHVAVVVVAVGRALERIGDHAAIIGTRLRYLLTGDPGHLAAEVR